MKADEVLTLLEICDLAKQWPNLKHIHDAAMKQLSEGKLGEEEETKKEPEKVLIPKLPPDRPDGMPSPTPQGVRNG